MDGKNSWKNYWWVKWRVKQQILVIEVLIAFMNIRLVHVNFLAQAYIASCIQKLHSVWLNFN